MRTRTLPISRRWLAATSLVAVLALAVAGAGFVSQPVNAQVRVEAPVGAPASFADLVDAVKPSVVSINVDGRQPIRRLDGENFGFQFPDLPRDHPFRRFFDQFEDRFGQPPGNDRPRTRRFQAAGAGFVISSDGLVVTNNHVVEQAENITVTDDNGEEFVATLIGTDARTDLALLKIEGVSDLPYVEFAEEDVRVGDWVVAVGNPFGLGGTVTAGIVSARGRDISANSYGDFIQIDAAINRGNSGGPAFNLSGQVIGVNTAIFSPTGGNVGIAFAIPAEVVQRVIADLMEDGFVTRGFLGVGIQDVSPDIAASVGLDKARGALVTMPLPNGPAGAAGIKAGDIILKVDGELIDDTLDLTRTVAKIAPGTPVDVVIWRNGESFSLEVILAERVEPSVAAVEEGPGNPVEPEQIAPTSVGLTLLPNHEGEGVVVAAIEPESIAAAKGFVRGEILLEANGTQLRSQQDFEDAIEAVRASGRASILVKVLRNGNVRFVGLPL
ncbi:MAG TPA: Do family serine endopeptidase [Devosia sp.]|nr:Do family serine endopeptidase [Devosia sp.]